MNTVVNRRSFFRRVAAGVVGAVAVWKLPSPKTEVLLGFKGLTINGLPLVYDPQCPRNRIYVLNSAQLRAWNIQTGERIA